MRGKHGILSYSCTLCSRLPRASTLCFVLFFAIFYLNPKSAQSADALKKNTEHTQTAPARVGLGAEARVGVSIERPAAHLGLEGHYTWTRFELGLGVEYNPLYEFHKARLHPGILNSFLVFQHRFPLQSVLLRQRITAGIAVLLQDFLGHPAASIGPSFELSPLGLEWTLSHKNIAFSLDLFSFNILIPNIQIALRGAGFPPAYRQYRTSVGLRF